MAQTKKQGMSRLERRNTLIAYSFLAPNLIGFLALTMVPVLFSICLAFLNWNGGALNTITFAGLNNFRTLFTKFNFTRNEIGITLKNTSTYALFTVPLSIASSLLLALALNKAVKAAKIFRTIFFFPYVASLVAICVCWNFMFMKFGPINQLLRVFGINIETITGYNYFDEMMESPDFKDLDSIVCARMDMAGSLGKTPEHVDSDELQVICNTLFTKVRAKYPQMENVLGGVLSPKSYPFISGLDQKAVDVYEARKVIFKIPEAYDKKAVEGFAKGLMWELLWCENKMEFFDFYAREDEGKWKSIKEAYDYSVSLL